MISLLPGRIPAARLGRSSFMFVLQNKKFSVSCIRLNKTSNLPTPLPPKNASEKSKMLKFAFPQRMVIFHAGTKRTAFLGMLKVFTVVTFGLLTFFQVPKHYYAEDQPSWVPGAVLVASIIPMVTVAYITGPFVAHIKLFLPPTARLSRETLKKFTNSLPKDALLEVYTLSFIGAPRRTIVRIADLYPVSQRFGLVNYARDTTFLNTMRPWWTGKLARQFGVHSGQKFKSDPGVWDDVARVISKHKNRI